MREYIVSGIIPAYAGNTILIPSIVFSFVGSSPHTRGTPSDYQFSLVEIGDHPRIRGEHLRVVHGLVGVLRIIPAYAGNTGRAAHRSERGDHPRIRGEH